jgi:hypothetical protein
MHNYTAQTNEMHNSLNQYLISYVSYMIRTSWFHPRGDSCVCRVVCFTYIGVSSLVDRSVFSEPHSPIHMAYSTFLPEDEPTKFETCRRYQKLNIDLENCAFR